MARLYPVVSLWDAARLERRRRLELMGPLVVEEKLDGVLLVGYGGRVYTGSGRRAPGWMLRGIEEAGVDLAKASGGDRVVYVELYGSCVRGETSLWRSYPHCFQAAFLDAARVPAYAGSLEEAVAVARFIQHPERIAVAEEAGLGQPRRRVVRAESRVAVDVLVDLLGLYPGAEGVVVKLYRGLGHRLPPEHGAKLRGWMGVKIRWEWFAEKWR